MAWKEGRKSDQISVISVQTPRFLLTLYVGCAVYLRRMRRSIGVKPQSPLLKFLIFSIGQWLWWDWDQNGTAKKR